MQTSINLHGKHVVVTGAIAGESRGTAEAKLRDAGATLQAAVTAKTDLLVTGDRVGARKMDAARAKGVQVISWADLWTGGTSSKLPAKPVRRARARTIAPMLAKAGDLTAARGQGWLFEVKWDGYRGVATVKDGAVTIQSRSAKSDLTERFPKVAAALAQLPDCVLDGELVDLSTQGGSFEGLANGNGSDYVVFDLLEYAGQDVRHLPLEARRTMLEKFLQDETSLVVSDFPVHLSPVFGPDKLDALVEYVQDHGLEGMVAKRRTSAYKEGSRNGNWLKIKVRHEQEFVVIGWTPGEGNRAGTIGSLVLGVATDDGDFDYVGRAGSGLHDGNLPELEGLLKPVRAWGNFPAAPKDTQWVVPTVVVQVAFQRWTEDGRLWHPSFKGIRTDKHPAHVRRES